MIAVIELAPLSLREIMGSSFTGPFLPTLEYVKERNANAQNPGNIWNIIHRGGYPSLQDSSVDWSMYFASYIKTYLERDVRELAAVQDLDAFRKFMIACAARTGQMLNYSNIADEVGKDSVSRKKWISILEASGIIYVLEPFSSSVLKRAIKTPKLFLARYWPCGLSYTVAVSGNACKRRYERRVFRNVRYFGDIKKLF